MNVVVKSALSGARRRPLAACCAALFALAAPEVFAFNTWHVTTCADSGPGSLRSTVADPAVLSGDTVDFSQLPTVCSNISVHTGAIVINQASLTLQGRPGSQPGGSVVITNYSVTNDSLINHQGSGTLFFNDLAIVDGPGHPVDANSTAGGCIYSAGSVLLSHAYVAHCGAKPITSIGHANGGGVYTRKNLTIAYSTIAYNYVTDNGNGSEAQGGGVYVGGSLTMKYSTISGNRADGTGNVGGGGVEVDAGNVSIYSSTISNNSSTGIVGGLSLRNYTPGNTNTATLTNSTISGNIARIDAGMYTRVSTLIRNSTIAFNQNTSRPGYSPGLTLGASNGSITVNLQSSLIANNTYVAYGAPFDNDIAISTSGSYTVTLTGANNLVRGVSTAVKAKLPQDTITGVCPLLGPLRNNGGLTQTHALLSGSPGIDQGNNADKLSYDQRSGPTPPPIARPPVGYPRVSGIGVDIGAYEVQQTDVIFNAGFEGCP